MKKVVKERFNAKYNKRLGINSVNYVIFIYR